MSVGRRTERDIETGNVLVQHLWFLFKVLYVYVSVYVGF